MASFSITVCSGSASDCWRLVSVWVFFPDVGGGADCSLAGPPRRQSERAGTAEARPVRSLVAARIPAVHHAFGPATTWAQYLSLSRLRLRNILRDIPFWGMIAAPDRLRHQQRLFRRPRRGSERLARYLPHAAVGRGQRHFLSLHRRHSVCRGVAVARARHCILTASMTLCRCANPPTGSPASLPSSSSN